MRIKRKCDVFFDKKTVNFDISHFEGIKINIIKEHSQGNGGFNNEDKKVTSWITMAVLLTMPTECLITEW